MPQKGVHFQIWGISVNLGLKSHLSYKNLALSPLLKTGALGHILVLSPTNFIIALIYSTYFSKM